MSQTAIAVQQVKQNNYAVQAGDLTLNQVAMDAANGNSFPATGQEIIIVQNTDSSAHTFTVSSVADNLGRVDSSLSSYSVGASGIVVIQMKQLAGWLQVNGNVNLAASSNMLKISVVRLN